VKTSEPWFYGKAILCLEDVGGLSYNNCVQQLPCEWFYEGENCQVFPLPAGNLAPLTMGAPYQMDYSTNADCTHFVSPVSRELLRPSDPLDVPQAKAQPRNSRCFSSVNAQCTEFTATLPAYLFKLDAETREFITTTAWEYMERNAHPRMAYFMRWCRESLEDGVFPLGSGHH
jgi:hypothetical protein